MLSKYFSRCRRIASVPQGCQFIQDPQDACCQTLKCDPTASFGVCQDALDNCAAYGTYVCGANYEEWARQNCAKYCNKCPGRKKHIYDIKQDLKSIFAIQLSKKVLKNKHRFDIVKCFNVLNPY